MKAQDDRYRSLFENIKNAIAVYRAVDDGNDFIFEDFNPAAETVEGLKREALVGKSVLSVFPGIREMGLLEVFQRVWRTGRPERHPVTQYEDDRLVGWRENYVFKLPSGEIVASYSDETARKQAEAALTESERKFHLIADSAHDWIYWRGTDGRLIYMSPSCERISGYGDAQFAADDDLLEKIVHPDDRPLFRAHLENEGQQSGPPAEIEFRIIARNGDVCWILHSCQSIFDEQGAWLGRRVSNRDVSERVRRDEIIQRQYEEITELSTPVIQVWQGIVIAPLIGVLDSQRTGQFMERFLDGIVETRSSVALVDITGVPTVDTQTAQHLIEAITAARLLGTRVILTGVRPAIAQTLVHLGIDLSEVETRASLSAGLSLALNMCDLRITRIEGLNS